MRSLEDFPDLVSFLEHVSLVMDASSAEAGERVSIMTLHGAKGLEFETVFLPGWEEGLFPHQRSLDDNGRAGLEEERRLAYVGLTRAKLRARIYFATNRRIHGLWQTTLPSRFLDNLPEAHVEVTEGAQAKRHGGYGASRFDRMESFGSTYATPGWQRAQRNGAQATSGVSRMPGVIEGELVAKSTQTGAVHQGRPGCSTSSSAPAPSRRSTATSSPSISTRRAARWCWTASCRRGEGAADKLAIYRLDPTALSAPLEKISNAKILVTCCRSAVSVFSNLSNTANLWYYVASSRVESPTNG